MEIKLLTEVEEKEILNMLIRYYSATDNGAARVVFLVSNENLTSCGLILNPNKEYVVKVALGLGGINQNYIESEAYRRFGATAPLAEIAYMGHYVEIMEKVTPHEDLRCCVEWDREGFINYATTHCYLSKKEARDAYEVIQHLVEINGSTNDNGQIGYNAEGKWVAYDYGYDVESDEELCSDMSDFIDYSNTVAIDEYLESLINILGCEEEALIKLERDICTVYEQEQA